MSPAFMRRYETVEAEDSAKREQEMSVPNPSAAIIADAVPCDGPGAREIGFAIPQQYNASRILFDNVAAGRGGKLALTGPLGNRSYAELCGQACRWGHGLMSLG